MKMESDEELPYDLELKGEKETQSNRHCNGIAFMSSL